MNDAAPESIAVQIVGQRGFVWRISGADSRAQRAALLQLMSHSDLDRSEALMGRA